MDEGTVCTLPTKQCKRGQYLLFDGRYNQFDCRSCEGGQYCSTGKDLTIYDTSGSTELDGRKSCPTSLYSSTITRGQTSYGAVACTSSATTACPYGSGTSADISGCYLCAAGTYQDGSGLTCNTCPKGLNSIEGSTDCSANCVAGTGILVTGAQSCSTCPSGYYNDGSYLECQPCLGAFKPNGDVSECSEQCEYPYVSIYNLGYTTFSYVDSNGILQSKSSMYQSIAPCGGINFNLSPYMATLISIMCLVYLLSLASIPLSTVGTNDVKWGMLMVIGYMAYTVAPAIDVITDVAYLLTSDFYAPFFFPPFLVLLSALSIFCSFCCFPVYLLKKNAMTKFRIWQLPESYRDMVFDDLTKLATITPWLIVNSIVWLPWLIFGSILF